MYLLYPPMILTPGSPMIHKPIIQLYNYTNRYRLVVSPIGGESRFVTPVVKRLQHLGALTQGDRHASTIQHGLAAYDFDTKVRDEFILFKWFLFNGFNGF